jgi:putative endonuclease
MSRYSGAGWERAAAEYLAGRGAEILARNYRRGRGEIDLVARMDGAVVFVEVKQRATGAYGSPGSAVTRSKQARICSAALYYLKEHKLLSERIRFDVVEIDPDGVRHIKSAFSYAGHP